MFTLLLALLLPTTNESRDFLIRWEGYQTKPYTVNGIWHYGVGHRVTANEKIQSVYSDAEIQLAFEHDLAAAERSVVKLYPSFKTHPKEVQLVLISLAYNMGHTGLSRFVKFKSALESHDYERAATELRNSLWYSQVGDRAEHHASVIEKHGVAFSPLKFFLQISEKKILTN